MLFRQLTHDDLGCASYLIGDEDEGVAAVVDPRLEIGEYLRLARYTGVRIEHILETHTHADHVSGHGRLAAATGATIHIHRDAAPGYDHEPFDDGWELELGALRVRALHTPGHRPEHTAFALTDTRPRRGALGRPDRRQPVRRRHRPPRPRRREARGRAPDLPLAARAAAHPAGPLRGLARPPRRLALRRAGHGPEDRLDDRLRARRPAAARRGRARTTSSPRCSPASGPQPPNFERIVERNRGPLHVGGADTHPLTPRQVVVAQERGALVVDVRTELQFDEAHVPGAVAITAFRAGFGSKLAWIAKPDEQIVLIGRDDDDARVAARLAASVGLEDVAGHLAGGMTSWREERRPVARIERITVPELHERRDALQILDVRERDEWEQGSIPGAVHTPYHDIDGIPDGIDPDRPVAAICASGQRAAVAASLLQRAGAREVLHVVDGGVGTWRRAGY